VTRRDAARARLLDRLATNRPDQADLLREVSDNTDLFAAGLIDSIDFIELIVEVETVRGRELDLAALDLAELVTLDRLVDLAMGEDA
jgi:acyl carrier protein